jgi:hypothetical protein
VEVQEEQTRRQCEQLENAWNILNDVTVELANRAVAVPPDIYVSLRGAKDLIRLCETHPKLSELTPNEISSHEGFCVACCGVDIVSRIKCELRNVEDLLVLKAMNELGSDYALKIQEKTMKAWAFTKQLTA